MRGSCLLDHCLNFFSETDKAMTNVYAGST